VEYSEQTNPAPRMICLTQEQCSEWLSKRGIQEAPYRCKLPRHTMYLQFEAPKDGRSQQFLTSALNALGSFSGALLNMTEWHWDPEYEPDPTTHLREVHGEHRSMIEVPGFVFGSSEFAAAIELGALVIERGWTGYLYLESNHATFLLWDGALIDFWSNDKRASAALRSIVRQSDVRIVHDRVGRRWGRLLGR
jgi:hypothetical protein